MEFFKTNTKINFLGIRKWTALLSIIIFIASIASIFTRGLNLGLDFTGGTQLTVTFPQTANIPLVKQALQNAGYPEAVVQSFGTSKDVLIKLPPAKGLTEKQLSSKTLQQKIKQQVLAAIPKATIQGTSYIGPQVGKEMATKGALAAVISMLATIIYIAWRFEWRLAIGAAVALIHDPILIIGVFSFFHLEFNLMSLAAVLAVIGYSINDTIVVFDRIRENFRKIRKGTAVAVVNLSINETLSRTIMTSALTLVAVLSLFLYGGPTVHGFALALIIGILIGTYSSIYVAGTISVALGISKKDLMPTPKKELEEMP